MPVLITYTIPVGETEAELKAGEKWLEARLNEAIGDMLKFIEQDQIKAYTATGNPPRPAGSDYVRTFTLQRASETKRTGTQLPDISGEWLVNESVARYAPYVVGSRAEQARIHRGRWKSRTQIEAEAREAAPAIVERRLKQ